MPSPDTGLKAAAPPLPPGVLSVVVPLYNERASLPPLHARLRAMLDGLGAAAPRHEIVFVDDGSRDGSFAEALQLRAADPDIRVLRFARNFGKEAAMAAGLAAARGDVVVLMDGDLQHPPELIPEMLARWRSGARVVTAVRRTREGDPWLRTLLSRAFYRVFGWMSEVELARGGGDFRLFDRQVVNAINSLPERTRFMKGIASWVGHAQDSVVFDPAERAEGRSSWSLLSLLRYAIDGLLAFSSLPLRIWSVLGLAIAFVSLVYGGWLTARTLIWGIDVPGYASLMVAVLFLSGVQLISLGVIGEYLARIYSEVKARPLYLVAERIGFGDATDPGAAP